MKRNSDSITAEEKIHFYYQAVQLFESGSSHPQIVELLGQHMDQATALMITDRAFKNEWTALHEKAARLILQKKLWHEAVDELSQQEPQRDVVEYMVNDIYSREFDVMHAEDKFEKKAGVWGYLLIIGIIQVVRYIISPYNKNLFVISIAVGTIGLGWGIWEFFLDKKDDRIFKRFSALQKFEQNERSEKNRGPL